MTFTYDSSNRVGSATDAIGQVTTVSYENTNAPLRITKVTDPFGRYATFSYNGSGQLTNIVDVLGLSSSFSYGTGDFISALTTPYGTSSFAMGEDGQTRWLEMTDPLGARERVEYRPGAPGIGIKGESGSGLQNSQTLDVCLTRWASEAPAN